MRQRRRLLLLVLGFACFAVLGAWLVACLTSQGDRISRESYNEIKAGMTEQEVEGLLGGPAGDYTNGRCHVPYIGNACSLCDEESYFAEIAEIRESRDWTGCKGLVSVGLNEGGRVVEKRFFPVVPSDPNAQTLLAKLRRWLGL